MHLLFFFIDGLGVGKDDPAVNPLARDSFSFFSHFFGQSLTESCSEIQTEQACFKAIDATLGVEGLPQSATGQTTLFTGMNAAKYMGRHVQAFPGPQLQSLLAKHNLLECLVKKDCRVTGANAYSPNYFNLVAARKRRHAATTLALLGAGLALRSADQLRNGAAIYQDITNETAESFGFSDIPIISPGEAGKNLARLALDHHFTLFEYFQTDHWGHRKDWQRAGNIVRYIDEMLWGLWREAGSELTLLITSDHGNFEDFTVKTHTRNPVPLWTIGPHCRKLVSQVSDLTDVAPAILAAM